MNYQEYFSQITNRFKEQAQGVRVIIARQDGHCLYDSIDDQRTSHTLSVLCASSWQASRAMLGDKAGTIDYRLSFDTSESGFFVQSFSLEEEVFYLCAMFNHQLNPALLKRKLNLLKNQLVNQWEKKLKNFSTQKSVEKKVNREGFLFQDITDDEMNKLFGLNG